jgi:hypothetical protein
LFPNPFAVNGLPYSVIRNVLLPPFVAALQRLPQSKTDPPKQARRYG